MLVNWYADSESCLGFVSDGGERAPKSTGFADASDMLLFRIDGKIGVLYESVGELCVLLGSAGDLGPDVLGSPTLSMLGLLRCPPSRSSILRYGACGLCLVVSCPPTSSMLRTGDCGTLAYGDGERMLIEVGGLRAFCCKMRFSISARSSSMAASREAIGRPDMMTGCVVRYSGSGCRVGVKPAGWCMC